MTSKSVQTKNYGKSINFIEILLPNTTKKEQLDYTVESTELLNSDGIAVKKEQASHMEEDIFKNMIKEEIIESTENLNGMARSTDSTSLSTVEKNQCERLEEMVFKDCEKLSEDETFLSDLDMEDCLADVNGSSSDQDGSEFIYDSSESSENEHSDKNEEYRSEDYRTIVRTFEKTLGQLDFQLDSKVSCPYKNCESLLYLSSIKSHLNVVHNVRLGEITCPRCQKKISHLFRHIGTCWRTEGETFPCLTEGCSVICSSTRDLNKHISCKHSETVKCPLENCDVHVRSGHLGKHLKQHKGSKLTCPHCGKDYFRGYLPYHIVRCTSDGVRRFRCEIEGCDSAFLSKFYLRCYVRQVHKKPMKCPRENCNQLINPSFLKFHIKRIHDKIQRTCPTCGKSILFSYFKNHSMRCKNKGRKKVRCLFEDCNVTFYNEFSMRKHVKRIHEPKPPSKCPQSDCNAIVMSFNLRRHVIKVHEQGKPGCAKCGRPMCFENLEKHVKNCDPLNRATIECKVYGCGVKFEARELLLFHRKNDHSSPVKCPHKDCNSMVKPDKLRQHVLEVHSDEKGLCEKCGKEFTVFRLKSHMYYCMSTKDEIHRCDVKECQATFKSKYLIMRHKANVHAAPVKCPHENCDVAVKRNALPRHIKVVHAEEANSCEKYGKHLSKSQLKRHMNVCGADGLKSARCTEGDCKASFNTIKALKKHKKAVHCTPVHCPYEECDVYIKPIYLKGHIKTVHEQEKDVCELCGTEVSYLKLHMKSCKANPKNLERIPCEICGREYLDLKKYQNYGKCGS